MSAVSVAGPSTGTYDVGAIAELLGCSSRHVRRLADAGRMPRPVHIGRLVRWLRADVDQWLAAGCPRVRNVTNRKGGASNV